MSGVLRREFWDGHQVPLGNAFELRKPKGKRDLYAVRSLRSHQFGWEPVLEVNGLLSRSQVCRSSYEVLDVTEHWRAAMLKNGWT